MCLRNFHHSLPNVTPLNWFWGKDVIRERLSEMWNQFTRARAAVLSKTGTQCNSLRFLKKHSETLLITAGKKKERKKGKKKKKKKSFSGNALREAGTIQIISSEGMWKCLPIYSLQLEFSPGYAVALLSQPVVTSVFLYLSTYTLHVMQSPWLLCTHGPRALVMGLKAASAPLTHSVFFLVYVFYHHDIYSSKLLAREERTLSISFMSLVLCVF